MAEGLIGSSATGSSVDDIHTLSEIRARVEGNLPDGYHSSDLTDDVLDRYINDAQRWVCRGTIIVPGAQLTHNFSFLRQKVTRDTVDGVSRYELPVAGDGFWHEDDGVTVRKFKYEYPNGVSLINSEDYREFMIRRYRADMEAKDSFRNTAAEGKPSHYIIDRGYLELFVKPDHSINNSTNWTINMEYYGWMVPLNNDNDHNPLTNNYPDILSYKAAALLFYWGFDKDKALEFDSRANELMYQMVIADQGLESSGQEEGLYPRSGQGLSEDGY